MPLDSRNFLRCMGILENDVSKSIGNCTECKYQSRKGLSRRHGGGSELQSFLRARFRPGTHWPASSPLRRSPRDEFRLQDYTFKFWRHFGIQNPQRYSRSFLPDPPAMLIDAGERNAKRVVIMKVPAAYKSKIFRDAYSFIERIVHCPHGERIVEAEDAIWPRF